MGTCPGQYGSCMYVHCLSNGKVHWHIVNVVIMRFDPGVLMWELWSGALTPYLDLRNQEVKGKVKQ